MSELFDDIHELLETDDYIENEINDKMLSIDFNKYFSKKLEEDTFFSNITDFNLDNNEATLIFKTDFTDYFRFNQIVLPTNYILDSPKPIKNLIYKNPQTHTVLKISDSGTKSSEKDDSIDLILYTPIIKNSVHILTEEDLPKFELLNIKQEINNILINCVFDSVEIYIKFITILYNQFHKYPKIYYDTKIKHKKQKNFTSFSLFLFNNEELLDKLTFSQQIKISYNNDHINYFFNNMEPL